jgi:hypothetical protein
LVEFIDIVFGVDGQKKEAEQRKHGLLKLENQGKPEKKLGIEKELFFFILVVYIDFIFP